MTEYIQREAVLKCLAYTTIWEPEQCPKCYTRLEPEETEG